MRLRKAFVMALALVMVCAVGAWAGQHGMGHHGKGFDKSYGKKDMCGDCPFKMLHGVDLTEAQTEKIAGIFNKYEGEHDILRKKMREARKTLREAVHSDPVNEPDIRKAAQLVGDQLAALSLHQAQLYSEIRPVLTAEQTEKLQKIKENRCERRQCHQRLEKAIDDYQDVDE